MVERKIRFLMAKPGLDGHDRGAKILARALRDAGIEVIYLGIRQTPEAIVACALQEGVDVIGLSCLSGAHKTLFARVCDELKKVSAVEIPVIAGGIIPETDIEGLKRSGIKEVFLPGTGISDIVSFVLALGKD